MDPVITSVLQNYLDTKEIKSSTYEIYERYMKNHIVPYFSDTPSTNNN